MNRKLKQIYGYSNIDGLIPGVRGQRAFPTPEFKESDPFLMLDHIGPQVVGKDFRLDGEGHDHPHRGFETITFMFEGAMEHCDSLGNRASLTSGSVQRMNAGSGIIHGGSFAADQRTARFHEMQLWINNPTAEKMSEPEIHNLSPLDIPTIEYGQSKLRVIAGELDGITGPMVTKTPTQIGHLVAQGNSAIEIKTLADNHCVMVYVLEGQLKIGDTEIGAFQLATFDDLGNTLSLQTSGEAQALILAGTPLGEPVVFGGPFVMNTQEEIEQANIDFQQGKFGTIIN